MRCGVVRSPPRSADRRVLLPAIPPEADAREKQRIARG